MRLKVGCRVDLCRRVVALQRALERRAARPASGIWCAAVVLLQRTDGGVAKVGVVVVQAVAIPSSLVSPADAEGHETNDSQDDGAANTDNHADDDVARLRGHARRLLAALRR